MEKFTQPRDCFGDIANVYDTWMSREDYQVPCLIADQLHNHFETAAKIKPFILDIGSGTGLLGKELKQRMPEANLTAIDLSRRMLQEAKKKQVYYTLHEAAVPSGLSRFSSGMFNAIASCGATEYIADTDNVVAQTSRILKAGGVACMSFLLRTKPYLDLMSRTANYYPKTAKAELKRNVQAAFQKHDMIITSEIVTTGYNDKCMQYAPDYYIVMAVKT